MLRLKRSGGVALFLLLAAVASAAALRYSSIGRVVPQLTFLSEAEVSVTEPATSANSDDSTERGTFIVLFKEAPLATYKGGKVGLATPMKIASDSGTVRLDVKSYESQKYVTYLQQQQRLLEQKMSATIGGKALQVRTRMQHAVNGIVVDMTAADAALVAKMPEVMLVEGYREVPVDTDTGPTHIGAAPLWNGTYQGATGAYQGEGVVVGIIDSGINFGSPSFAAVDPVDAYAHVNPLGAGNYLGTCAAGGVDAGRCNDKLIGGYDFVCGAPGNQCGVVNIREEPGFGDTSSHGSHTASTVAGNRRDVLFTGNPRRISGVAPRANIIAYDVCYTNTATGQGLCPNVSSVAAVNQAIADGIVDTLNFSIGGGTSPWTDAVSLAFLNAVNAGIYVAASAGNSGPAANTLGHVEPWVSTTAAAQHGRGGFAVLMSVTGPGAVPANLAPIVTNQGSGGVAFAATIPGTTPLKVSAGINSADDACVAYPAGTFAGAIAVVRRGTCSFSIKVNNASAAGAVAVVISNNIAGVIIPSVPGTTVPVFSVLQSEGDALRDFAAANPTATAQITFPAAALPNTADALGSFSSRGPAGTFDLLKPDVTGPGVDILAVIAGTTITGSEQAIGLMNGTSMSSPHNAGAGTLMRQARPTWTVPEIKSALMMTAVTTVYLEDQVTLANAFARGAGRLQIDRAVRAGLVLNETAANFTAANPGTGGDPKNLNIASYANKSCSPTCSFTRTFRNTQSADRMWNVKVKGLVGTVSTPSVFIPAGQSRSVRFTINTSKLPNNGSWNFGEIELSPSLTTPAADASPVLRMPVAVAVAPPVITLPASVSKSIPAGGNSTVDISVSNTGGSTLNYTISNSGTASIAPVATTSLGVASGFRNTVYSNPATAGANAQFSADDFNVVVPTNITSLSTEGFVVSAVALPTAATSLRWSIYPDAAGLPAGNPQTAAGAAVWTYSTTPVGAGVTITGGKVTLNLAAAGQSLSLPPGKYWLVANTAGTFANRWAQYGSNTTSGNAGFASITIATNNTGAWAANAAFNGLTMVVRGTVTCGAAWLGTAFPAYGSLAPAQVGLNSVAINGAALSPGSYAGNVCYNSNDPVTPSAAVPVLLTVTPAGP
ncbi:MAG: S8 family serine peptidase [Arenimonas sp.]